MDVVLSGRENGNSGAQLAIDFGSPTDFVTRFYASFFFYKNGRMGNSGQQNGKP